MERFVSSIISTCDLIVLVDSHPFLTFLLTLILSDMLNVCLLKYLFNNASFLTVLIRLVLVKILKKGLRDR
ncbi:352R [Invertebrate iridescent virus Kaz2018]|nr:352R [Invertebrate iridescent virus Kaz2018]